MRFTYSRTPCKQVTMRFTFMLPLARCSNHNCCCCVRSTLQGTQPSCRCNAGGGHACRERGPALDGGDDRRNELQEEHQVAAQAHWKRVGSPPHNLRELGGGLHATVLLPGSHGLLYLHGLHGQTYSCGWSRACGRARRRASQPGRACRWTRRTRPHMWNRAGVAAGFEGAPLNLEGLAAGLGQRAQLLHDGCVLARVDGRGAHGGVRERVHRDRLARMLLAHVLQYLRRPKQLITIYNNQSPAYIEEYAALCVSAYKIALFLSTEVLQ